MRRMTAPLFVLIVSRQQAAADLAAGKAQGRCFGAV
jgi:hypothetical protein